MARQFTKGIDLYEAQKARLEQRALTAKQKHADMAAQVRADAIELTGGGISSATLTALGHPFGRQNSRFNPALSNTYTGSVLPGRMRGASRQSLKDHGLTRLPLLPINKQHSGGLQAGLHLQELNRPGFAQSLGLMSDKEYSKYILNDLGTVFMVGRGFQAELRRRWKARNKALIDSIKGI